MPLSNDDLLRVLLRLETVDRVRLRDLAGPPLAACESRLFTLMEQEGVQPMFAAHLRITWERWFEEAGDEGVPSVELRAGLHALRLEPANGESTAGFSERATLRLVACAGSLAMVDWFGDEIRERKALETGPLFRTWPAEILEKRRWNTIKSVFPGLPDLQISEAWVHLRLRKLRSRNFGLQAARIDSAPDFAETDPVPLYLDEELEDNLVGEPLLDVLHQIRNLTCVLGQPGAGKSTLIKWLARHLVTEQGEFFTLPLFVNLREYALHLEQAPGLTLFDFFLRQRGIARDADQTDRWSGLRQQLRARGTTEARDFFFWLLDGWDEVPDRLKEAVLGEIRQIAEEPGIITTRHSANPLGLPCGTFWEISVLPRHAQRELAANWLRGTGSRLSAEQVMARIQRVRGCERLARNPMLLTLLCGLLSERGVERGTLRSRSDIYRETIRRVADHHTGRHPSNPFDEERLAQTRTLAARLFTEAEAPVYGFTEKDVSEICHDPGFFQSVLKPSRLVCCPSPESSLFQFHHASFQEYLTAEWLAANPTEIPRLGGSKLVMDAGWAEVARFAAILPSISIHLWESLRGLLGNPDRYGVMLARAAGLLASAGSRDGGRRLLGRDVREELWSILMRHRHDHPWMITDALTELDSRWLLRRMASEMERHPEESENTVLPFAKHLLLAEESQNDAPVEPLFGRMQEALEKLDFPAFEEAFETVPDDESGWELKEEAIRHMHSFGAAAVPFLTALLTSDESHELIRGMAAAELASCEAPEAGRTLMRLLAGCEPADDLVWHVLGALNGSRLSPTETSLVSRLLVESPCAAIREEAAAVLGKSRLPGTAAFLLQAASGEVEEIVRGRIWTSLLELTDPAALPGMREQAHMLLATSGGDPSDAIPLLLAAGMTAARTPLDPASREILDWLTCLCGDWLESGNPSIAAAAANLAVLLGDDLIAPLTKIVSDHDRAVRVRIEAVRTLGELRIQEAVAALRAIFDFPDCECDEDVESLHAVAAQALGKISPEALLRLSSPQAERERARLAFTGSILFFDEWLDQPSSPLRRRKNFSTPRQSSPSLVIYGNVERSIFIQGHNSGIASAGDRGEIFQQHEHTITAP